MSQEQDAPFIPPPPPTPVEGSSLYPPHVLESKAQEAKSDAKNALILSIVGLFCFGFILGIIAFRKANSAIETIDMYEVAKDSRGLAVGAKVLAIFDIVCWVIMLIARIALS
ncbi:MAG TPA: hypothetical protein VN844_10620 [Pyrinomonadaceae bacterium]|nr:hypothetical protein [Pyrinomonadaceae bacterium]